MDTRFCFLLLSLLLFSLPSFTFSIRRCNPNDQKTLMAIKESLNNPSFLYSWNSYNDSVCCDWDYIDCDPNNNRIRTLTIVKANISGQIPSAVGDLPYLETLVLAGLTNLTGEIPASITKLENLEYLDLSSNHLSGSIPDFLSSLTKLNALHLEQNELTGNIPESFGKVSDLYLSKNQLTGEIPKSFGSMEFRAIDLSSNNLVGNASMLFNPSGSTQMIDISMNQLEFTMWGVRFPKTLTSLDLSYNKIGGTLPDELIELDLHFLNASHNQLCGFIPSDGNLQDFDSSSYTFNRCLRGRRSIFNSSTGISILRFMDLKLYY